MQWRCHQEATWCSGSWWNSSWQCDTHDIVPGGTRSYGGMIGSYWELHFGEQHDGKKGYGFKE